MNFSIIVILILSFATTNLCSGAFINGNAASKKCQYLYNYFQQQGTHRNSCPHGWHENQCKIHVCYRDEGDICGSERDLFRQLKFGKCAKHLECCEGICAKRSECLMPHENQDFSEFFIDGKRNSFTGGNTKMPLAQLEYEEY